MVYCGVARFVPSAMKCGVDEVAAVDDEMSAERLAPVEDEARFGCCTGCNGD